MAEKKKGKSGKVGETTGTEAIVDKPLQTREEKEWDQRERLTQNIDDALEPLSVLHRFFREDQDAFEIESSAFYEITAMVDRAYHSVKAAFNIFDER